MNKNPTDPPTGALYIEDHMKARWVVYHDSGLIRKKQISDFGSWWCPEKAWRINRRDYLPKMGYAFENYFHAYAYSLKCKNNERNHPT